MLTDIDFYVNDYGGEYASQGEKGLKKLLRRAERDVWCVCSDEACSAFGGKAADEWTAEILKTAVCVQADFLADSAGNESNENTDSDTENINSVGENTSGESIEKQVISSVKLGDFSVNYDYISQTAESGGGSDKVESGSEKSGKESAAVNEKARGSVCEEALLILDKGGLLYRGGVRV